ncbi:DUF6223 family protein [Streptomyces sp. NPDC052773]|uniref:DUF6223 family protein n=1 Tax=Streptomyces sp. NPDC052773 TaxID=3365693 RepID=UPI0037D122A8
MICVTACRNQRVAISVSQSSRRRCLEGGPGAHTCVSERKGTSRSRAGVIALVVGGAVAVAADGGLGTGNGLGGACFAMFLGVLALTLGRPAHSRSRSRFRGIR